MYLEYFGLSEAPFSIAPDPRYLYMSDQHREALAHLLYSIRSDGAFVLLTGEVGTGKTTVCRCLLEQMDEDCDVAFVINPRLNVQELLSTICDEFRIRYPRTNKSIKVFVDLINAYLLDSHAGGRRAVLIIDEAQNLSGNVLEQIRLLTNLETNRRKLLQVILLGQPELRDKLARPELRQLSQRIIARYHLGPLNEQETGHYINHRLSMAGSREKLFPSSAMRVIFRRSGGIPRLMNMICDRSLLGAYTQGKRKVDRRTAARAAVEVLGERIGRSRRPLLLRWYGIGTMLLLAVSLVSAAAYYYGFDFRALTTRIAFWAKEERTSFVLFSPFRKPIPQAGGPQETSRTARPDVEQNASEDGSRVLVSNTLQQPAQPPADQDQGEVGEGKTDSDRPLAVKMERLTELAQFCGEESAYQALFQQWGATFNGQEKESVCRQAEKQGLRCLSGRGGLEDLRKWNRPAVLKLSDGRSKELYAALTSLREDMAAFTVGDETLMVMKDDLLGGWLGEYTLLWRSPPGYRASLQAGQKGPLVEWLKARLARIHDTAVDMSSHAVFDSALEEEVKRFQLSSDLTPDGIVGPQTLSRLIAESDTSDAPVLTKRKKEP